MQETRIAQASIFEKYSEHQHGAMLQKLSQRLDQGVISLDALRIDSTVVGSDIAPPSDSQLLHDAVPVMSRLLATSHSQTGVKIRFTDQRKSVKSLAFRIFNAKKADKDVLYPDLLKVTRLVIKQAQRALDKVTEASNVTQSQQAWCQKLAHYRALAQQVVTQTERRVILQERVPSSEKIVSLFEPHTDIIVKGFRSVKSPMERP